MNLDELLWVEEVEETDEEKTYTFGCWGLIFDEPEMPRSLID